MKTHSLRFIAQGAIIAALYVVLTMVANAFGLASGIVQVRLSEMLTILPYFTLAAVPGLTLGCLLANILTGSMFWDVILGSLATLIGAVLSAAVRQHKWLVPVPPIVANTLIIPFVLSKIYAFEGSWWFFALTVGIGEIISCGVLGMMLLALLEKRGKMLFHQ